MLSLYRKKAENYSFIAAAIITGDGPCSGHLQLYTGGVKITRAILQFYDMIKAPAIRWDTNPNVAGDKKDNIHFIISKYTITSASLLLFVVHYEWKSWKAGIKRGLSIKC